MEPIVTDQLILNYLNQHTGVPPRQIAKALHICVSDVRYHLQKLLLAGLVSRSAIEQTQKPGRPAGMYEVVKHTDPTLLSLLLKGVFAGSENYPDFFPSLARNLLPAEISQTVTPSIRILKIVQFLNSIGYDARWESRPDHPVVELRNCPYHTCFETGSPYCQLDLALLEIGSGFSPHPLLIDKTKSKGSCGFILE